MLAKIVNLTALNLAPHGTLRSNANRFAPAEALFQARQPLFQGCNPGFQFFNAFN